MAPGKHDLPRRGTAPEALGIRRHEAPRLAIKPAYEVYTTCVRPRMYGPERSVWCSPDSEDTTSAEETAMHYASPRVRTRAATLVSLVAVWLTCLPLASETGAATWHVTATHPPTPGLVAAAAGQAASGDTLRLSPGRFLEHVGLPATALTVIGSGMEATVLDGSANGYGTRGSIFSSEGGASGDLVLQDLTLRNGQGRLDGLRPWGGAIYWAHRSSLIVRRCRFEENVCDCNGTAIFGSRVASIEVSECDWPHRSGGIYATNCGDIVIADCEVDLNREEGVFELRAILSQRCRLLQSVFRAPEGLEGQFLMLTETSDFVVEGCRFETVASGPFLWAVIEGGDTQSGFTCAIRDNVFWRPPGTGHADRAGFDVALIDADASVTGNTLAGTAISLSVGGDSHLDFSRNVLFEGGAWLLCGNGDVTCNVAWPDTIERAFGSQDMRWSDNRRADPLFCDLASGAVTVDERSPCVAPQAPDGCVRIGAGEAACRLTPIAVTSWGRMKSRFQATAPVPVSRERE